MASGWKLSDYDSVSEGSDADSDSDNSGGDGGLGPGWLLGGQMRSHESSITVLSLPTPCRGNSDVANEAEAGLEIATDDNLSTPLPARKKQRAAQDEQAPTSQSSDGPPECTPSSECIAPVVLTPHPPPGPPPAHHFISRLAPTTPEAGGMSAMQPPNYDTLRKLDSPICPRISSTVPHLQVVTFGVRFHDAMGLQPNLLVDTRCFRDPGAGALRAHDGHHPEILLRMSRHEFFTAWLQMLKRNVMVTLAASAGQAIVIAAVFCRSGRHRSVAAASILLHLACASGVCCLPPKHLSLKPCGCGECREDNTKNAEVFAHAERIWNAA